MGVFARFLSRVGVNVASAPGKSLSSQNSRPPDQEASSACPVDVSANRQQVAGQLAGAVAHDLNNLLATILGCLELMERRLDDPERLKALIKRSGDAVDRAAGLTSRLAQFARRQPGARLPTDVNAVIADLAPLFASALGRRVRVSTRPSNEPAFARVDPVGLETTLLAACLTARAAIPEMGQITVVTQMLGSSLAVSVAATGPGFGQLDLRQTRHAAEAAGIAIQLGQVIEGAQVIFMLPSAGPASSSGETRPSSAANLDLHDGAEAEP